MKNLETRRRPKHKVPPASVQPPKEDAGAAPLSGARAGGVGDGQAVVSPEERRQMIELAAYYRAERRGFSGGSAEEDWIEAEAEIDRALAGPVQ